MSMMEETIDAVLDGNGQLRLAHQPHVTPGPVRVTIRVATEQGTPRGLSDVVQELATEQRARGFPGRSAEDVKAEEDARLDEDAERDRKLNAARLAEDAAQESPRTYTWDDIFARKLTIGVPPDSEEDGGNEFLF